MPRRLCAIVSILADSGRCVYIGALGLQLVVDAINMVAVIQRGAVSNLLPSLGDWKCAAS